MNSVRKSVSTNTIAFRHSMQARLLLIILAITLIPIVALQTYSLIQTMSQSKAEINKRFEQVATDETQFITAWSAERILNVRTLASLDAIKSFDGTTAKDLLYKYRDMWGHFETFALINSKGITDINTDRKSIDIHDRPYFIEGITGKEVVSDPAVSRGTGNVIVVIRRTSNSLMGSLLV